MKNAKIASILISVSMTILVFTGCGSNTKAPIVKSPIITKTPVVTKTPNTTNPNQNNQPNQSISTATVKTLFSKTLKGLVTTKTITQTQSRKVLAAITKNMSQGSGTTNNSTETTPGTDTNMTPNTGAYGGTSAAGTGTNMTPNTGTSSGGTGTDTGTTNSTNQTGITDYSTTITNELISLVKSRVITQTQANTIHQKIQAELINMQNKSK